MLKALTLLILFYTPLFAVQPCPDILQNVKDTRWPPAFSMVFTEPSGRNLVPGQFYLPGAKEKILVVLTEFSDGKFTDHTPVNTAYGDKLDENYFSRLVFGGDYISFNKDIIYSEKYNSVKRYYKEISYNQCEIIGNILKVALDKPKEYYTEDGSMEVDNENIPNSQILKDVILKLNQKNVKLGSYDYDQDGYIDHLLVITALPNQAVLMQTEKNKNNSLWPKRCLFTENAAVLSNNIKLGWGMIVTFDSPVGVIAHEFFHELGGADLYDPDNGRYSSTDDNDFPVFYWDLMDMGSWCYKKGEKPGESPTHPLGFYKWKMGWIEPEIISRSAGITIKTIENNKNKSLYKINTGKGDYFLIENRNPFINNTYYDKSFEGDIIPMDSGLVITHIDENITSKNENISSIINWGSPEFAHYAVQVMDIKPKYNNITDERKYDAAFSEEDGQKELTPASIHANTLSYFSKDPVIFITKIGLSGNTMKANIIINKTK